MVFFKGNKYLPAFSRYYNGNIKLTLIDPFDGEPFMTVTTNTDTVLPKHLMLVKNYSENKGIFEALYQQNHVTDVLSKFDIGFPGTECIICSPKNFLKHLSNNN